MKQIRGYQIKESQIKELPNSKQVPLRARITTEFSLYNLWVQKAVVLGKKVKISLTDIFQKWWKLLLFLC